MEIIDLKSIPIDKLMSNLGYEPVSRMRGGTQLLYRSPFRDDRHPSFSVSVTKNLWHDYAIGKGGNVIDLAIILNGNCSFHNAAVWLEEQSKAFVPGIICSKEFMSSYNPSIRDTGPEITGVNITDLTNRVLLSYLQTRRIPSDIGKRYCREAHYFVRGRPYYGICFLNILGGMEIRNAYFKGCYGIKGPSIIALEKTNHTETCCVFEGFMDFLSFKTLVQRGISGLIDQDCIVLNSTSLVGKAIPFINVYDGAFIFTDNDQAGRIASQRLSDAMPGKVTSMSGMYSGWNDLNDYLICGDYLQHTF